MFTLRGVAALGCNVSRMSSQSGRSGELHHHCPPPPPGSTPRAGSSPRVPCTLHCTGGQTASAFFLRVMTTHSYSNKPIF